MDLRDFKKSICFIYLFIYFGDYIHWYLILLYSILKENYFIAFM